MYNDLMLGESGLSKLEREMIAVVVSSINHCYYCLTAHGAAVRHLSGDPALGEMMVMNFRAADLPPKQTAMLEFAVKLTDEPARIVEADRAALRKAGFSDRDIWDIASTAAFFNMIWSRERCRQQARKRRLFRLGGSYRVFRICERGGPYPNMWLPILKRLCVKCIN